MHFLDTVREQEVREIQIYLSVREATQLRALLDRLLTNPDAMEHYHLPSDDRSRELSCSILTPNKLETGHYTDLEKKMFSEQ
jgi:hypothetical protein